MSTADTCHTCLCQPEFSPTLPLVLYTHDIPSLAVTYTMPGLQRGGRIRGKYTRNERAIIDPFKEQYMKTTTLQERQHVAMNLIYKQLFVYWTQNDGMIDADDAKVRGEVR